MKRKNKSNIGSVAIVAILVAVVIGVGLWAVLGGSDSSLPKSNTNRIFLSEDNLPLATSAVAQTNETAENKIVLTGDSATYEGSGVKVTGNTVMINRAGVYHVSGNLNGRILVNAKGEDVVIILDGVNITCPNGSPFYVYKASSVTLVLQGGTVNTLTDGESYDPSVDFYDTVEQEPNACLFSKGDLVIRGTGSLKIKGNYSAGLICKDTLQILNTNVEVDAKNNGVNGKDYLLIQNSTVKVNAGGDGLRSTQENNPTLGYISIKNSNITVNSGKDGIQAETGLILDNSSIYVVSGGGSNNNSDQSAKGLKCKLGYLNVNGGNIILDSADDAMNIAGNVNIENGVINITTGDDAVHSDSKLTVSGGTIVISQSKEGLEAMSVEIVGGNTYINAKSDGINAAGGSDSQGFDGMGSIPVNDANSITISGGYIYISTSGDGLDSNGNIYLNGGTLIVNGPTDGSNAALDYSGDFFVNGGTLLATGSKALAQAPDNCVQNVVSFNFNSAVQTAKFVQIKGKGLEFAFVAEKPIENMIFSSPELELGETYTVSYGGSYKGGNGLDCVYQGGKYSGGESLKLELSGTLTAYGRVGVGGSLGGQSFGEEGKVLSK